ncbi:hypothetical protein D3C87_2038850 [compost metagenome]
MADIRQARLPVLPHGLGAELVVLGIALQMLGFVDEVDDIGGRRVRQLPDIGEFGRVALGFG